MVGNRYFIREDESELREIERDLAAILNVPFVYCEYDAVASHKHRDEKEIMNRKSFVNQMCDVDNTVVLDYVINYELYETSEERDACEGGFDGEVYEIHYLVGCDNMYLVITDLDL